MPEEATVETPTLDEDTAAAINTAVKDTVTNMFSAVLGQNDKWQEIQDKKEEAAQKIISDYIDIISQCATRGESRKVSRVFNDKLYNLGATNIQSYLRRFTRELF